MKYVSSTARASSEVANHTLAKHPRCALAFDRCIGQKLASNLLSTGSKNLANIMHCGAQKIQPKQKSGRPIALPIGGSVAEWSVLRTRNPAVPGSSPTLATTWICFKVAPSSNPRSRLFASGQLGFFLSNVIFNLSYLFELFNRPSITANLFNKYRIQSRVLHCDKTRRAFENSREM